MNTHPHQPERSAPVTEEAWVERAIALLDESAHGLDAATVSRLNRARQSALAPRRSQRRGWMIGGSFAAAAIALVLALGLGHRPLPGALSPTDGAQDDLDALVDDDSPDLYENLDFYAWLDVQQQGGNG